MISLVKTGIAILAILATSAVAQTVAAGSDTPPVVFSAQPPMTQLDTMENQVQGVVVKATQRQPSIVADDGSTLTVIAVRMTVGDATESGIALEIAQHDGRTARAYIDDDHIADFIGALDSLSKIDHASGSLDKVDAIYHLVNVHVSNVDDNGAREAIVRVVHYAPISGQVTWTAARFRGARLAELRQQVIAAQKLLK